MKITCDICSHIWENQRYRKCADGKNRCKNCHKEYYNEMNNNGCKDRYKDYSPERKKRRLELSNIWRKNNPDNVRNIRLKTFYGISLEGYKQILEAQNHGCGICGKPPHMNNRSMPLDHCHQTRRIRGILCSACNTALGTFGDSVDGIKNVLSYLEREVDHGYVRE